MSEIQFNLLNRRSSVSGYKPTGLRSGEIFVQMADSAIMFKNTAGETVCFTTSSGQFQNTGDFITASQTGQFAASTHVHEQYVLTGSTGIFITTGQTGAFGSVGGGAGGCSQATGTSASNIINGTGSVNNTTAYSFIGGGTSNVISGEVQASFVGAGASNRIVGSSLPSNCNSILGGRLNNICDSLNSSILGGVFNCVVESSSSSSVGGGCRNIISGSNFSSIFGTNNCAISSTNVSILGSGITVSGRTNSTFVNDICSTGGKYYGDGSALTGLPTGSFITTGQTGNFLSTGLGSVTLSAIEETFTICSIGTNGLINFNVIPSAAMYYSVNSSGNFYLNLRGDASTTLNSILDSGKTLTVSFFNTNGVTAYALTGVSIDGTGRTIKWLNGTGSYPAGNPSSVDSYSVTAFKTGTNSYIVLGSQGRFV
jgi:hypothetical protein